jgi:hypothetical protein
MPRSGAPTTAGDGGTIAAGEAGAEAIARGRRDLGPAAPAGVGLAGPEVVRAAPVDGADAKV